MQSRFESEVAYNALVVQWQNTAVVTRGRWIVTSRGLSAAAHGCGLALVRRVVRIDTGERLEEVIEDLEDDYDERQEYRRKVGQYLRWSWKFPNWQRGWKTMPPW